MTDTLHRFILCLSALIVIYSNSFAQTSFDEYKRQMEDKYNQFKSKKNKEFEEY